MAKQQSKQAGGSTKAATINKTEGVRQALAQLGQDAPNDSILAFLKKRFGFKMTMDHLYVVKSDLRRRQEAGKKPASKPAAKAESNLATAPKAQAAQPLAAPATAEKAKSTSSIPQAAPKPEMTKRDVLRQALKALGKNAQPLAIQGFLKEHYDMDMTREHISKYKRDVLKQDAGKKAKVKASPVIKMEPKKAAAPKPEAKAAPASSGKGNTGKVIPLEDIEAVKTLVSRIGADQFRNLIDLIDQ
jgi:hypothetical protein